MAHSFRNIYSLSNHIACDPITYYVINNDMANSFNFPGSIIGAWVAHMKIVWIHL